MRRLAHEFRGEYIELCAQIECWAVRVISDAGDDHSKRMPHLFGQKLKLIGELAKTDEVFRHPERISELLEKLAPYAALRSSLAHATLASAGEGDDAVFAFELPVMSPPDTSGRFWLTPADMTRLITALKKIRKELSDQKVLATSHV